jgi:hypothetical protein
MASIRLTQAIKKQIIRKAEQLFETRIIKKVDSLRPDFWDDLTAVYIADYFTPYMNNRTYPDDWYIKIGYIDFHFADVPKASLIMKRLNKEYRILAIKYHLLSNQLIIREEKADPLLVKEYSEYESKIDKLKEEATTFKKELEKVLHNCNTLSQFLKLWPQGEHIIEGLNFETTKRTRRKREVEVDESTLATLNSGLLKQKMLNS